ncbi:glycosyltransferase family 2 protein [Francisella philomiragia]|uniref:glycosyltransferase family 2 protein n=1 Tax=Francisella philomiragia TaxID=28110 RepID=UPI001C9DBFFC|nr:glycosyltransferase family 2 protein [Francisella philomiragia]MBY7733840.1 glycosyltransferase [Francisella philomiragia]
MVVNNGYLKFSVITVCYNSEKTIQKTLQSIKDQTYKNIEYIIIDGGSTDRTLEIINQYSDIVDILVSEPDNGIYDAMNKGIKLAVGDYIGFLNSDDYYAKDIFEKYNMALKSSNGDYIYSDAFFLKDDKKEYVKAESEIAEKVYQYMPMSHMSLFVKSYFVKNIKFDTSFKIAADLDFFNKLREQTSNNVFIHDSFSYFSMGGISNIADIETLWESKKVAIKHKKNILFANLFYFKKIFRIFIYNNFGNSRVYKILKVCIKKRC